MDKDLAPKPLISIIMPAYNASRFIDEAIQSVKAQTYGHWELIVIDDGSTDQTAAIVQQHQETDHRIIYHHQQNRGLGSARNSGLQQAKGEWVGFLDSDDLWLPDKLQQQVNAINTTIADVIFSQGFYLHDESGDLKPYDSLQGFYLASAMYSSLIIHNSIAVLSVIIKKSLVDQIGLQDTHQLSHGCEDWDYWLRACLSGASFYGIAQPLFKYRLHGEAMSNNQTRRRIAAAYVLTKNYRAKWLNKDHHRKIKKELFSVAKLIIKHIGKSRLPLSASYIKLLLKIFLFQVT